MKISAPLVFLGLGLLGVCAHADPIGMAANVKGNVTVTEDGKTKPLRLLNRLEPGVTVTTGAGSSAVIVLFKDGARYEIGPGKSAKIGAANVAGGQRMAAMSGPSSDAVRLLGNSRVGAVSARPPAVERRLNLDDKPYKPYVVGPTPTFDWSKSGDGHKAVKANFILLDSSDNIVWCTSTTDSKVTYPADGAPLLEKQPYTWKVTEFGESEKPSASYFGIITILSAQDANELEKVASSLRADAKATPKDSTPLLLLAALYRDYGVFNGTLEILTDDPIYANETANEIKASMSPFARVMLRVPVTP